MQIKLPYIRAYGEEIRTPYGFLEVTGLDAYEDIVCRDKVVYRVDMLLCLADVFSEDTISKCRNLVYNTLTGKIKDKEKISNILTQLYLVDNKFKRYLGEVVYFSNYESSGDTLYSYIIKDLRRKYLTRVENLVSEFKQLGSSYVCESAMYVYFGFDDKNITIRIPEGYQEEMMKEHFSNNLR